MRVLIACEFSGRVRDAFTALGHDATSCDLLPSESPGKHYQGDVMDIIKNGWDMMIAHPPCTYLSYAGLRWFKTQPDRYGLMLQASEFVQRLWKSDIPMIAIENPRGYLTKVFRRADQVVNPCDFGDPYTKETHLWLKNMPPLMATLVMTDPFVNWTEFGHRSPKERSRTFPGVAHAMANQWGALKL